LNKTREEELYPFLRRELITYAYKKYKEEFFTMIDDINYVEVIEFQE